MQVAGLVFRLRNRLRSDLTCNKNKLDAAMQHCGFRLSNYVSSTGGKICQSVVRAIADGVTDTELLVKKVHGRTVGKHGEETIMGAVTAIIAETGADMSAFEKSSNLVGWCGLKPRNGISNRKMKIQVAIARKVLVAVWHILSKKEDFIDLYLKRLEERAKTEAEIQEMESSMGA